MTNGELPMDSLRDRSGDLHPSVSSLEPGSLVDHDDFRFVLNQPADGPLAKSPELGELFHAEVWFGDACSALMPL